MRIRILSPGFKPPRSQHQPMVKMTDTGQLFLIGSICRSTVVHTVYCPVNSSVLFVSRQIRFFSPPHLAQAITVI